MEWIKCSDRLPEEGKNYNKYLIVVTWLDTLMDKGQWKSFTECAYFNQFHKTWLNDNESLIVTDAETVVTHWMPLPEPPKE